MRCLSLLALMAVFVALFTGCESNTPKPKKMAAPRVPTVGYAAPEIEGEDLDGKPFKLSDYKGKVVLLDFWGMWCPPCKAFLPHGKLLVHDFKDRPFVALGVNTDEDVELPKKSQDLAMRCWADRGRDGPISRRWNISGFPTLYVIDHEGIIRKEFVGAPRAAVLHEIIDGLVKKAEGKS